jgi:thiol-disulfide isomerase/thioredoxin
VQRDTSQNDETRHLDPLQAPRSGVFVWIGLGILAVLSITYFKWRNIEHPMDGADHPAVGRPLLLLELEPLTGDASLVKLSDLAGQVTLINLWGTWCPPCAEEFPYLAGVYDQFKGHGDFRYLSVSYNDVPLAELRESTEEFLARRRVDHATYYDPSGRTMAALMPLGAGEAFPTTIILGRDGTIKGLWQGFRRASIVQIEEMLARLLRAS